MCGRYSLTASLQELAQRFEFDSEPEGFVSRYNVSPTQQVLTVVGGEARKAGFMRWGLIPSWSKDGPSSRPLINARAETVAEKPSFRGPLKNKRCLVPADGFYEWQKVGDAKRPMRIVMRSGEPFAFAGLWSVWDRSRGQSHSILRHYHHRGKRSAQADPPPNAGNPG